ncbi:glycine cleavage system aminomethyltransferase GcvT [Blattabacterium cuenoti]|uniref:glycine cleavage system aminomethyltransferase GcvT n=1 Tax=Blattabacterium cuenoti TaxID=1653831 RepID=UPI00163B8793|nr:glycine cleavage system aminomethyltransferase GcvT [Blattabacterium cuenoti]
MDFDFLKKTTLYKNHIKLGAKMEPFSGFLMPFQYDSSLVEHMSVRKNVGIFDISHMGKFFLHGKDSKSLLQYITTNNLSEIKSGQAQYSCLINKLGGIIDDLVIYKFSEEKFLLIINASNIEKNKKWIKYHIKNDKKNIQFLDKSNDYSIISIQGPNSFFSIQKLTDISLKKIPFYSFNIGKFAGIKDILISYTGYTGSKGVEIYIPNEYAEYIWKEILRIGSSFSIQPCGLLSRNSLRLEMGYRLYGQDLDENTTPIEAGLSWITKFKKDFLAKEILQKQKKEGNHKKFLSFLIEEKGKIPRFGYHLKDKNGKILGKVTSGVYSPILKKGIGLGFIFKNVKEEKHIFISIRNKNIPIKIVKLPFVDICNS